MKSYRDERSAHLLNLLCLEGLSEAEEKDPAKLPQTVTDKAIQSTNTQDLIKMFAPTITAREKKSGEWLDSLTAERVSGLSRSTLVRRVEDGLISARQTPSKRWYFSKDDCEALVESRTGRGAVELPTVQGLRLEVLDLRSRLAAKELELERLIAATGSGSIPEPIYSKPKSDQPATSSVGAILEAYPMSREYYRLMTAGSFAWLKRTDRKMHLIEITQAATPRYPQPKAIVVSTGESLHVKLEFVFIPPSWLALHDEFSVTVSRFDLASIPHLLEPTKSDGLPSEMNSFEEAQSHSSKMFSGTWDSVRSLPIGSIVYPNLKENGHQWIRSIVLRDGLQIGADFKKFEQLKDCQVAIPGIA